MTDRASKRSFMKRRCMLKSALCRRMRGAETDRLAIGHDGEGDIVFLKAMPHFGWVAALLPWRHKVGLGDVALWFHAW